MSAISKILRIVDGMSKDEIKDFRTFLNSPFLNKKKNLEKLLDFRPYSNKSQEEIYQAIFPNKRYNKQVLKNLLSTLMKAYKKYLAIKLMDDDVTLLEVLAREKANRMGVENMINFKKRGVEESNISSWSELSLQYFLLRNKYKEIYINRGSKVNLGLIFQEVEKKLLVVEMDYMVKKVNVFSDYIFFRRKFPFDSGMKNLENAIENFKLHEELEHTLLYKLYNAAFSLVRAPCLERYIELKQLFIKNMESLHSDHMEFFLTELGNYCVAQINRGDIFFREDLFEIYLAFLGSYRSKKIPSGWIMNFVILSCRIGKATISADYLHHHKERIDADIYTYCTAIINFYQKNYELSLVNLRGLNIKMENYRLNVRYLIAKNLYALKEYEATFDYLESLRIFLMRSKDLNVHRKRSNLNFVKYFQSTLALKRKEGHISKESYLAKASSIKSKLVKTTNIIDKDYLVGIINDMLD